MGKSPVSNSVPNETKSSSSASDGSSQKESSTEGYSHSLEISIIIVAVLAAIAIIFAFRKKIASWFKKQKKSESDETLKDVEPDDEILEPKTEEELEAMVGDEPEPEETHELEDK